MIFTKIARYFSPVEDISTFERKFHSILHAECSAYVFQRQNKPRDSRIAFIRRFWRKLCVVSLLLKIFRRLKARFSPFYMQNVVNTISNIESNPETLKLQSFVDFHENYALFLSRLRYLRNIFGYIWGHDRLRKIPDSHIPAEVDIDGENSDHEDTSIPISEDH